VNVRDVRVIQLCEDFRFTLKPREPVRISGEHVRPWRPCYRPDDEGDEAEELAVLARRVGSLSPFGAPARAGISGGWPSGTCCTCCGRSSMH
jgi:hypothetical protein